MSADIGFASWLQGAFALCVVLGLLWAAARVARRAGAGGAFGASVLKPVASLALSQRERIVVVELGEEWIVVGVGPGQVRTLHVTVRGERPEQASASFTDWLRALNPRRESSDGR